MHCPVNCYLLAQLDRSERNMSTRRRECMQQMHTIHSPRLGNDSDFRAISLFLCPYST